MSLHSFEPELERAEHPLDVVERLADRQSWAFDRSGDDEIALQITGHWANYNAAFTWLSDVEALHMACGFDLKVPALRWAEVRALITMINEQRWVGHFDMWPSQDVVLFRHALLLSGGAAPTARQCESVLNTGLEACERYFQAFHFVLWAGKSAREALDAAMFETLGEA